MEGSQGRALWKASEEGRLDVVQRILNDRPFDNKAMVHFHERYGKETPLHAASERGHIAVMELLLSHGANIEAKNLLGLTPLIRASYGGQTAAMEILLRRGASMEAHCDAGYTPLFWASKKGQIKAMQVLLRYGADIEAKDSLYECTPLIAASKCGHSEVMEILLRHGANIYAEDNERCTSLFWAVTYFRIGAVEVLLRHGAKVDSRISGQDIPLISALWSWDTGEMKDWLYRRRYTGRGDNPYNRVETLLQWAMIKDDDHFMSLLLQHGGGNRSQRQIWKDALTLG